MNGSHLSLYIFLATFKGCISDEPEFDTFVSEVEAKRLFNKEKLPGAFGCLYRGESEVVEIDGWNVLNLHNNSFVNSFFKLRCLGREFDWTPAWRGSQVFRSPRHYLGLSASSACLGSPWRQRDTLRGSRGEASWARRQQTSGGNGRRAVPGRSRPRLRVRRWQTSVCGTAATSGRGMSKDILLFPLSTCPANIALDGGRKDST